MAGVKRRISSDSDTRGGGLHKELDEISCPICMEHPHNAVLLLCSSHDKGCRSYVCDTSYRHSNCLDRFKKLRPNNNNRNNSPSQPGSIDTTNNNSTALSRPPNSNEANLIDLNQEEPQENRQAAVDSESLREMAERDELDSENNSSSESSLSLKCPLCRGPVLGWEVVEEARKYLNSKKRSCSRESCSFSGDYPELRRHARRVHPATRPSDVDPSRERAWRRLEHQRELGDVVSAIRSAMPGAMVVGDYVIENNGGDRLAGERGGGEGGGNRPWLTTLFLFQMIGSVESAGESRARPRGWTRHRRSGGAAAAISDRRLIWGENLLGLQDDDDDDDDEDEDDDDDEDDDEDDDDDNGDGDDDDMHISGDDLSPVPRRRRRLARSRSDEDQP